MNTKTEKQKAIRNTVIITAVSVVILVVCSCHVKSFSGLFPARPVFDPALTLSSSEIDETSITRTDEFNIDIGKVEVIETALPTKTGTIQQKHYFMPDGVIVNAGRIISDTPDSMTVLSFSCGSGMIRWFEDGAWQELDIEEGSYTPSCAFFDTDRGYYIVYLPKSYTDEDHGIVFYNDENDGSVKVVKDVTGDLRIDIIANNIGGDHSDYFYAYSSEKIIDWSNQTARSFWSPYHNDGYGKMLYDNYYWIIESEEKPAETQKEYSNRPSCYFGLSCVEGAPYYPAMKGLAVFIIDTMMQSRTAEGYAPCYAVSEWLQTDYNIGTDYYDTRFNSDLAEIYIAAYDRFGGEEFIDALNKYMDYYVSFAGKEGWYWDKGIFVPDYYSEGSIKTHTALNHQLAEMSVLYKCGELLNRPELTELANKMLVAIEESAKYWIKSDHDLYYAVFSDRTFGLQDYDYLTYDDMFNMQKQLEGMGRKRSSGLKRLMDNKKIWMDRQEITLYKK